MFYLILELIFFLALGAVVFVFAKKIPVIDSFESGDELRKDKRTKQFYSEFVHKADFFLTSFFEKMLRKTKLFLMKMDNLVGSRLDTMKNKKNGNGGNGQNIINELSEKKEEKKEE